MKHLRIRQLIWDDWNTEHIALHTIVPEEVQEVCKEEPVERKAYKNRIFLIGVTKKHRMLTVILEPTGEEDTYRPITAYDASKRSRQDYENEKRGGEAT